MNVLEGYDDASLSLLAGGPIRFRLDAEQMLVRRFLSEPLAFDATESGILAAIELFPSHTSLSLISALESWRSHQQLVSALSRLEMRLFVVVKEQYLAINPLRKEEILAHTALGCLFTPGTTLAFDGFCLDVELLRGVLSLVDQTGTIPARSPFPACGPTRWKELRADLETMLARLSLVSFRGKVDHARYETFARLGTRKALALCLATVSDGEYQAWSRFLQIMEEQGSVDLVSLRILLRLLGIKPTRKTLAMLRRWGLPSPRQARKMLLVDSDRSISYEGAAPPDDLLWRFATLESEEHTARYQISRDSIARALAGGLDLAQILSYLKNHTTEPSSGALEQAIRLIGDQYQSIRLTHAILLEADERTSRLIEALPPIHDAVLRRPAKGLYVMDGSRWPQWSRILQQALGFLPHLEGEPYLPPMLEQAPLPLPVWEDPDLKLKREPDFLPGKTAEDSSQVEGTAEGFDYQAKVMLVKQHLKDGPGSYLEIDMGASPLLVKPLELEKTNDGEHLLRAEIQPSGEIRNLRLRTIYTLRVRHWPLF